MAKSLKLLLFLLTPSCLATGRFGGFPDCTKPPLSLNDVCNIKLTPNERAKSLISAFTVQEKVANLVNTAPGVPRLGLPEYEWWNEALHGIADSPGSLFNKNGSEFSFATSFPMPINLGSSFDDEKVSAMGRRIARDGRAFNNYNRSGLDFWTPNINPYRDPRWGRGTETPGEDPYHIGRYIRALLSGMHHRSSNGTVQPIIATCKHFAAYDIEGGSTDDGTTRFNFDAKVTLQELSEYYLPPFKACVDADVGAIMCSYNSVNGVPACADEFLIQKVLREHWGWGKGKEDKWVVSDCQAIQMIREGHNYSSTKPEAAAKALKAGTDLECGTYFDARFAYYDELPAALNQSLISMDYVDKSLIRLYSSLIGLGYFDPLSTQNAESQQLRGLGWADVAKTDDDLAYELAVESLVLVKNDGILPLDRSKSIALIGPWANETKQMQGNYAGPAPHLISILSAGQTRNLTLSYSHGSDISSATNTSIASALSAAQKADVILFAGGIDGSIEFETKDRPNITWPTAQTALLSDLQKLRKPLIVVQLGGPVDSTSLLAENGSVNALLWAGYPGQEGGKAILDVVLGVQAPSGRMPVTVYPASYVDDVPITDMNLRPGDSNNGLGRTHMWYTGTLVVPFGHGLSYTEWEYEIRGKDNSGSSGAVGLNIQEIMGHGSTNSSIDLSKIVKTFEVKITNSGSRSSSHVVLAFLHTDAGPEPLPKQTLVGYKRSQTLAPGASTQFEIGLTLESLARTDESGSKVLYPGTYWIRLGNERYPNLERYFVLTGEEETLEKFPQPETS